MTETIRWLRVREAAWILGVSESTVRRWLYQEKLEGFKIGGVVRINTDSIERMATTHRYADVHKTQQISALARLLRRGRNHNLAS